MPDWYNSEVGASAWNNEDGTFTVSNSTSWNAYNYLILLSVGEKYRISINAKRIFGNGGIIYTYLDAVNDMIYISNTFNIDNSKYNVYSSEKDIEMVLNRNNNLLFYFPNGEINVKYIKIEQISENAYIKNNDIVIFTSDRFIDKYNTKIDNIYFKCKLKSIYFDFIIYNFILIAVLVFIYLIIKFHSIEKDEKIVYYKDDFIFIKISIGIAISLFIFHFWLCFPGFMINPDILIVMDEGVNSISNNWHPRIISLFLSIMYKIFGLHTFYILFLNLFLWYFAITVLVVSLYLKFKNKKIILLFLISFLSDIFFTNINHMKDFTATLWIFLSYSLMLSYIIMPENKKLKIITAICFFITLIIGMLWRHNFIVAVYPVFIFISYKIIKNKNDIVSIKKYILTFSKLMIFFAIIIILIYKLFPKITYVYEYPYPPTNSATLLQIMGCAVPNNDFSMIPLDWYKEGKTFEDAKQIYDSNPVFADPLAAPWLVDAPFLPTKLHDLKKVWIQYIIKYPISYLKHILNIAKELYFIENGWKYNVNDVQMASNSYTWPVSDIFDVRKISFNNIRSKIYDFLYNFLPSTPTIYFIVISFILAPMLGLIWIFNKSLRNDLLLFSFTLVLSSIAINIITVLFIPAVIYRYIYPVIPITIISLISFIAFIYSIGGFKRFIKELWSKKL